MFRRSLTLSIAGLATLIAIAVAVLVPVPYVILGPGPTLNTLGQLSGQPLISISGHPTYPTSGNLNLVTISLQGGPGVRLNVFQALRSWLDPSEAVVPSSELFPPGQSAQETQAQDTEQMPRRRRPRPPRRCPRCTSPTRRRWS
jgi:Lon-like protease